MISEKTLIRFHLISFIALWLGTFFLLFALDYDSEMIKAIAYAVFWSTAVMNGVSVVLIVYFATKK